MVRSNPPPSKLWVFAFGLPQLNETSRAAIDEWQEKKLQRACRRWTLMEQNHARFVASLPPKLQSPRMCDVLSDWAGDGTTFGWR